MTDPENPQPLTTLEQNVLLGIGQRIARDSEDRDEARSHAVNIGAFVFANCHTQAEQEAMLASIALVGFRADEGQYAGDVQSYLKDVREHYDSFR